MLDLKDLQIVFHKISVTGKVPVELVIARLDLLHQVVSGNKIFKLHYFLEEAKEKNKSIITFGGAYSNHLVATAYAANTLNIPAIGYVRGDQFSFESPSLQNCRKYGMQLQFLSREAYQKLQTHTEQASLAEKFNAIVIPEGGYHPKGAKGAGLIMQLLPAAATICLPVGTATTLAGLALAASPTQQVVGFPVLKNMTDIEKRVQYLAGSGLNYRLEDGYHFGGYARHTPALFTFMNQFYNDYQVPLDFVYTAKMMYGVLELISSGSFSVDKPVICLHTGGLQGNSSLEMGTLVY